MATAKSDAGFDVSMARVRKAIVPVLIEESGNKLSIGSGVLVKLGGKEFVLTAGHNVWSEDDRCRALLRIFMDVAGLFALVKPDSVDDVYVDEPASGDPDPDVAVIVPSSTAVLSSSREPFEEDEIDYFDGDSAQSRLLLTGLPGDMTRVRRDLEKSGLSKDHPIDTNCMTLVSYTLPGQRCGGREPAIGRGVHLYVEFGGAPLSHARGMSGGPLTTNEGKLIGLMRSTTGMKTGFDAWCEPVVEAVRLLLTHPNADVAAAANRVVDRIDGKTRR